MAIFPTFFLGSIGKENVFCDILEQRNAFLGYKNKKFKSRKIDIFPKGLTHGFGPKMAIFPTFFFGNIGQENVFYDILEQKNAFLGYKNNKFKNSKNWHFFKGVNPWFWSNNGHFSNFFFRQYRPGKWLLRYVFYEKSKNCIFLRGQRMVLVQKWPFFPTFFF